MSRTTGALGLLVLAALLRAPDARAQTPPPTAPSQLPSRTANFAWDQSLLRATFSFTDIIDGPIGQKLSNGPTSTIVVRALVFRDDDATPVTLALQTCAVTYDLWEDVYKIKLTTSAGTRDLAVANLAGVTRTCGKAQDLAIATRSAFKTGVAHFLAVLVDVNPVNATMRAQMRQWMQRPAGSVEVGPGDALFSAFVGLLLRDVAQSDRTLEFRTQAFVP
jgi:hypothetical protein